VNIGPRNRDCITALIKEVARLISLYPSFILLHPEVSVCMMSSLSC